MFQGCPDGNGCTLQEAQTVCSSAFGSDTSGIVFEPTTLAINDAVLQAAKDAKEWTPTSPKYWIGVNNDDLTYHSNGNPVSIASIPWFDYNYFYDYDYNNCVTAFPNFPYAWRSHSCDDSSVSTICEMTS